MDHLYRFRTVEGLVGKHQELQRQEIYFAPTDALNDPLEGYLNVVWRGDRILWRNLLRNYLVALVQVAAWGLQTPLRPDEQLAVMRLTRIDIRDQPIAAFIDEFTAGFLAKPMVERLVRHLATPRRRIGRDELAYWLWTLHPSAIGELMNLMIAKGFLTGLAAPDSAMVERGETTLTNQLEALHKLGPITPRKAEAYYSAARNTTAQLALIHDHGNPDFVKAEGWRLFTRQFPDRYVEGLTAMVYPPWNVACFVEDPRNAAMWGNYGDQHRGICLKFATEPTKDGFGLALEAFSGRSANSKGVKPHIARRVVGFQKVHYTRTRPLIEFFTSLGNLPRDKVMGDWLADDAGRRSPLVRDLDAETEEWRRGYWDRFYGSHAVKTPEWAPEREQRLVLNSSGPLEPELRKGRYDFAALTGIIFGIRTSDEDKRRVLQAVEAKCREVGRRNFEFHQAYWSTTKRRLEIAQLTLLKFDFDD